MAQWEFAEELAAEDAADALDQDSEASGAARVGGATEQAGQGGPVVATPARGARVLLALRLQLALELVYAIGLRREEAVAATVDDLRYVSCPVADGVPVAGWTLRGTSTPLERYRGDS